MNNTISTLLNQIIKLCTPIKAIIKALADIKAQLDRIEEKIDAIEAEVTVPEAANISVNLGEPTEQP